MDPLLVLHDGTIMVPFVDFPSNPEQTENWTESRIWTVVSTDGGVTFSEPKPGPAKLTGEEVREARQGTPRFRGGSWTMLAADRSERFPGSRLRGLGELCGGAPAHRDLLDRRPRLHLERSPGRWRRPSPRRSSSSSPRSPSTGTASWG